MPTTLEHLTAHPLSRDIPREALDAAARCWKERRVSAGEVIWAEGAAVDELALIAEGTVQAVRQGVVVANIPTGEILGEIAAFFSGHSRSTAIVASSPTTLLVLGVPLLRTLRWQRSPLYFALLDHALATVAVRLRGVDAELARMSDGSSPVPRRPGRLQATWHRIFGRAPSPAPDPIPTLRMLRGLEALPDEVILKVAGALEPVWLSAGDVLCLEGEEADCAWLVHSGAVQVLRTISGDKAELLSTVRAGAMLGLVGLVDRGPRSASCVALEPGWAFRVSVAAAAILPSEARLHWRECVLAVLGGQLREADAALTRLRRSTGPAPAPMLKVATESIDVPADEPESLRVVAPPDGDA